MKAKLTLFFMLYRDERYADGWVLRQYEMTIRF